jgi:cytidyltransferase-related domain
MRIAVYPGSFDPITNGHLDVLKRALGVFDEVILLLAVNPSKKSSFSVEERLQMMKEATKGIKGVQVDYYPGLTGRLLQETPGQAPHPRLTGRHRFRVRVSAGGRERIRRSGHRYGFLHVTERGDLHLFKHHQPAFGRRSGYFASRSSRRGRML